ncbi:hypothetical protein U9M48_021639 [Paspalum notatum var. saurae]|uniref:Uncharacterized protein n=1 Tax=Paspalum notatum var. saurae TaxID=547442 RepID=A0AAQ3WSX7_PASNO
MAPPRLLLLLSARLPARISARTASPVVVRGVEDRVLMLSARLPARVAASDSFADVVQPHASILSRMSLVRTVISAATPPPPWTEGMRLLSERFNDAATTWRRSMMADAGKDISGAVKDVVGLGPHSPPLVAVTVADESAAVACRLSVMRTIFRTTTPPPPSTRTWWPRLLAGGTNGIRARTHLRHHASPHTTPILQMLSQSLSSSTTATSSAETIRYTIGLFDSILSPKWGVMEYASLHIPIKRVKAIGEEKSHEIITEQGKLLLGSLALLIEKLQKHGYTFKELTISDLCVDEYGRFVLSDQVLLDKVSGRGMRRSYSCAAAILEDICKEFGGKGGEDFQHYLSIMKTRKDHRYMIQVHPAMIPLQSRGQAFIDAYDVVMSDLTDNQKHAVLQGLEVLNKKRWTDITENEYLTKWFSHGNSKNFDPEKPGNLFTNLRNIECHSLAYLKDLGPYTKDELRELVASKVPMLLPNVYWKLHCIGQFHKIEGERYFCLPGMACCPAGFCLRREIRLKQALYSTLICFKSDCLSWCDVELCNPDIWPYIESPTSYLRAAVLDTPAHLPLHLRVSRAILGSALIFR